MLRRLLAVSLIMMFGLTIASGKPTRPPEPPDLSKLKDESIKKWAGAELLVVGKFTDVKAGPVGLSNPPLRTYTMTIAAGKVLRGDEKTDKITAGYAVRQDKEPTFPDAKTDCLIALKFVQGSWVVQSIEDATADNAEQAKMATSFPLGWTLKAGKLVSPWAAIGKAGEAKGVACSVTGRPVLLVGDGVRLSVEPVQPKLKHEFKNPDGDGEYKLTVKNETKNEVEVPALVTDGKEIRWNESIVIRCQDKVYPIPGSTGRVDGFKPVVLKAGESASGVVNVFALNGPEWPMGGYRIEFQFCLAERSVTHSFYYLSKHHDPIREAVLKGMNKQ